MFDIALFRLCGVVSRVRLFAGLPRHGVAGAILELLAAQYGRRVAARAAEEDRFRARLKKWCRFRLVRGRLAALLPGCRVWIENDFGPCPTASAAVAGDQVIVVAVPRGRPWGVREADIWLAHTYKVASRIEWGS